MARAKQVNASTTKQDTQELSGESSDDMGNEVETVKPSQTKIKANVAASKSTTTKATSGSKIGKGKGKATADDDGMEIDSVAGKPLKRVPSASSSDGYAALLKENERLKKHIQTLTEQNDELVRTCEVILKQQQQPTRREKQLQEEIEALNAIVERGRTLLELRNSEYTKSKLINHDPDSAAEYVTLEYAEEMKNSAIEEYAAENEDMRTRLVTLEDALKVEKKEKNEAKRQLTGMERELAAEVEHSKKLQAEASRRPVGGSSSSARTGTGIVSREMEKKLELLENLSGIGILSYTESIRQPGNSKSITYTCVLTVNEKGQETQFPFRLVVWDERMEDSDESEHVVYSPGEPIDSSLQLEYLAGTFTFPRSQLGTFYQNMVGILIGSGEGAEEEEEEEEE